MIVISLILVVVSAISLLIGGLFSDGLELIYVSIAAALLAGVFLAVAWIQSGRRRKPLRAATLPGEDAAGKPATWQGASWTGAATADDAPLTRGDAAVPDAAPVSAVADTESLQPVTPPTAPDDAVFAPPPAVPAAPVEPTAPAAPVAPSGGGWAPPPPPPGPGAAAPTSRPSQGTPPPPPPPPA